MANPFIGEIKMFGGTFAPVGWAMCNGQLMNIADDSALYSLIGTTYGGDGVRTFGLPNLQGRVPLHFGTAATGSYVLGQQAGTETVTLTAAQLPSHTHPANATTAAGGQNSPAGGSYATGVSIYGAPGAVTPMAPATLAVAGSNQPHDNMMPFLTLTFIIATVGIFPSRN